MPNNELTLEQTLEDLKARYLNQRVGPYYAWNKVSRPLVWQWCSAMGDENPLYQTDNNVIAPPTMLQMWAFRDVHGNYAPGSTDKDTYEVLTRFNEIGFSGSVAVSYDQTYHHYLREGDQVHNYSTIVNITDQKSTGLGDGYFVTEKADYYDQDERLIGEALVTYFKYKPPEQTAKPAASTPSKITRIHPVENHDTRHYWQGLREGKLLLQQCSDCLTFRHPPQPMCESCQSLKWEAKESKGLGTVHSYTVMHYPEIPPFDYPNPIVLVDLEPENVRLVSQFRGSDPDSIRIGQTVQAHIEEVQENLALPIFEAVKS